MFDWIVWFSPLYICVVTSVGALSVDQLICKRCYMLHIYGICITCISKIDNCNITWPVDLYSKGLDIWIIFLHSVLLWAIFLVHFATFTEVDTARVEVQINTIKVKSIELKSMLHITYFSTMKLSKTKRIKFDNFKDGALVVCYEQNFVHEGDIEWRRY